MWETKQGLNCCQLAVCVWTTVGLQCVNATERNMRPGEVEGKERNMHINWLMRTGAGESRPLQRLEWGWGEGVPKWSEKPFLQGSIVCWPWLWKESWLQETACCVASTVACSWSLHVAVSSDVSLLLSPPKKKKELHSFAVRCLGLLSQVWIAGCECFCSLFPRILPDKANPPSPHLKMTCVLLKAFKWSRVLADYQIHCLVARETHTHGLHSSSFSVLFFSLPPLLPSPEAHISKPSAVLCAHTAAFQLKAFCASSEAEWRGERADGSG